MPEPMNLPNLKVRVTHLSYEITQRVATGFVVAEGDGVEVGLVPISFVVNEPEYNQLAAQLLSGRLAGPMEVAPEKLRTIGAHRPPEALSAASRRAKAT